MQLTTHRLNSDIPSIIPIIQIRVLGIFCMIFLCIVLSAGYLFPEQITFPPKYDEVVLQRQFDEFISSLDYLKVSKDYPEAIRKLLSGNPKKQNEAVRTLAETGEIEVIPWLLPLLDSDNNDLRIWTGASLEKLVSSYVLKRRDMSEPQEVVIKPLGPEDKDLRPLAWIVLKMFRKPDDGSTQAYAAEMTRYLELYEFEAELKECLNSKHPGVKNKAELAIASLELRKKVEEDGLCAFISLNQTEYKIGDEFIIELTFQNTSDKPCYLYLSPVYRASDFLITDEKGKEAKTQYTVIYKLLPPGKDLFHLISPNETLKFEEQGRITISGRGFVRYPAVDGKEPLRISFWDVDQIISNPGRFKITYRYNQGTEFVSKLSKKLDLENVWLGAFNSNTLEFSVRLPTQEETKNQLDLLSKGSQGEKAAAIEFLKANLELKSIPSLMEIMGGKDYGFKEAAAWTLIKFRDKSIIPQLLAFYEEKRLSSDDEVRLLFRVIFYLEDNLKNERGFLIKTIDGPVPIEVKRFIVNELGWFCVRHKDPDDISLLLEITKNSEPLLRKTAVYGLGGIVQSNLYPEDLRRIISDRLVEIAGNDPDDSVRFESVRALK